MNGYENIEWLALKYSFYDRPEILNSYDVGSRCNLSLSFFLSQANDHFVGKECSSMSFQNKFIN